MNANHLQDQLIHPYLTAADLTAVMPGLIVVLELTVRQLAVFLTIAVLTR